MYLFWIANLANNPASELNSDLGNKNPEPHKSTEKCCSTVIKLNEQTVFLLITAQGAYFISKLWGPAIVRKRHLNERGIYLKVRRVIYLKFENFVIISFQITVNNNDNDI